MRLTVIISFLVALGLAAAFIVDFDGDDASAPSRKAVVQQVDKPASKPADVASVTPTVAKSQPETSAEVKPETSAATSKTAKLEAPKDIPKLVASFSKAMRRILFITIPYNVSYFFSAAGVKYVLIKI